MTIREGKPSHFQTWVLVSSQPPLTDVRVLMVGAAALGACLSWLAVKTQSIRTAALLHILGVWRRHRRD